MIHNKILKHNNNSKWCNITMPNIQYTSNPVKSTFYEDMLKKKYILILTLNMHEEAAHNMCSNFKSITFNRIVIF